MLPVMLDSKEANGSWKHRSVMVDQVVSYLAGAGGDGVYIDATVGSGGHTAALLDRSGSSGVRVLGIDRDTQALERAGRRLRPYGGAVCLRHGCFSEMKAIAAAAQWPSPDGIVMDIGVSTDQLADAGRGFSFSSDGPLDMRMDPGSGETAADMIAELDESALCGLFRDYGEEPAARRIARRIVRERARAPIVRTARLAAVIASACGGRGSGGRHPATRCFQALRIAVNRELEQLEGGLEAALALLRPGGRLVVIAFHSLEDRRVKTCFRLHAGRSIALAGGGSRFEHIAPRVRILTRRPLTPDAMEVARNPRARSAKMRVVEKEGEDYESNTTKSG